MEELVELRATPIIEDDDEIVLPPGATSLTFLQQVYRDHRQPLATRMRAALGAIAYEHPRLSVAIAVQPNDSFAQKLELAIIRSNMVRLEAPPALVSDVRLPPTPRLRRI